MSKSFNTPFVDDHSEYATPLATKQKSYYEQIIVHVNSGGTITQEVYNSLAYAHQYHFNRYVNYTGTKIFG